MTEQKAIYDPIHRPANPLSREVAYLQNDVQELRALVAALTKGQDELSSLRFRMLQVDTVLQNMQTQTPQSPSELLLGRLVEAAEQIAADVATLVDRYGP